MAHESRYIWILNNFDLNGKCILDFGCGSGYGSHILSNEAEKVHSVDISKTAIEYANCIYKKENLKFLVMDATDFDDISNLNLSSYDFIVSFDVIEHIEDYWSYLYNICSLLKRDGTLIIGCPNRFDTFNWKINWNEFHLQEFTPLQFRKLLSFYFEDVSLLSQDFKDNSTRELVSKSVRQAESEYLEAQYKSDGFIFKCLKMVTPKLIKKHYHKYHEKLDEIPKEKINYSDIEFSLEPGEKKLRNSFGLIAICKNNKLFKGNLSE